MKPLGKMFTTAVISGVLVSGILASEGIAASPGSTEDPLVSKSYVDDKINQVIALISGGKTGSGQTDQGPVISDGAGQSADTDEIVSDVLARIDFLYGGQLGGGYSYVPVNAAAGQVIYGGEGTEIILRSGKAEGLCPGENGIVDATDGTEIMNGSTISINHILIVPRDDGRGVAVTSDEAWFIIKGEYTLK